MLRHSSALIAFGIIVGFVSIFPRGAAYAYAVPGTTGITTPTNATSTLFNDGIWNSASWQNLGAPFQNFTHSLRSIGTVNLGITTTVSVFSDAASQTAHGAFEQFDAWLAGIIGFHISQIFIVFLELTSWLLAIVKNGIDRAISWIH